MGGLIGINESWLRNIGVYNGRIIDAPTGVYIPSPITTETISGGGLIIVIRFNAANAVIFQITGGGALYVRTTNVNTNKWSNWLLIVNPTFPE